MEKHTETEARIAAEEGRSIETTLCQGDRPPAGATVTLRRDNYTCTHSDVEWFVTDGSWHCPTTENGHYYTAVLIG